MKTAYYLVDGQKTYKTFDAWQMIYKGAKEWRFYLNEEAYNNEDWSIEPKESLDFLSACHAANLRAKYKKLRLWYSAGRDSHYILKTFVKNNIPLDEIAFVDWAHHELVRQDSIVVTQAINAVYSKYNQPLPTITFFKPDAAEFATYWKFVASGNHSGGIGSNYGFNLNSFSVILDLFFNQPEVGNIFGIEKPRLAIKNNQVLFQMVDSSLQHVLSPHHNIEWFFLSPEAVQLTKKQLHMLIRTCQIFSKLNGISLSEAVTQLQYNKQHYDLYCNSIGLGPMVSAQTGSGLQKSFGLLENQYQSIHRVSNREVWAAGHYFKSFIAQATDLVTANTIDAAQHKQKLPGIVTNSYIIK